MRATRQRLEEALKNPAVYDAVLDADELSGYFDWSRGDSDEKAAENIRRARLVTAERQGRRNIYRLADRHVAHIVEDALAHAAEET